MKTIVGAVIGVLNGLVWESKRLKFMFIKLFWIGLIALACCASYLFQEARVAVYSRKALTVSADEIKRFVLRTDRFVSVAESLRMENYFVSQEHGSEVYYTVFRSSSGLVVTKSDHPTAREVDRLEGILEPLPPPVLQAVVKAFPRAPTVSLNVVRRPISLWISGFGLAACSSLLVGFLATGLGLNGFQGLPLEPEMRGRAESALRALEKNRYWAVRWVNRRVGGVAAAVVPGDEAMSVVSFLKSELEVADMNFETGESKYDEKIRYLDIRGMRYGRLPVWTRWLPALEIRHGKKTVLYAEAPDVLIGILALVGSVREAGKHKPENL